MQSQSHEQSRLSLPNAIRYLGYLIISVTLISINSATAQSPFVDGSDAYESIGVAQAEEAIAVVEEPGFGGFNMGEYYNGFDMCDEGQDGIPYGPCGPGQDCVAFSGGGNICVCTGCDPPEEENEGPGEEGETPPEEEIGNPPGNGGEQNPPGNGGEQNPPGEEGTPPGSEGPTEPETSCTEPNIPCGPACCSSGEICQDPEEGICFNPYLIIRK